MVPRHQRPPRSACLVIENAVIPPRCPGRWPHRRPAAASATSPAESGEHRGRDRGQRPVRRCSPSTCKSGSGSTQYRRDQRRANRPPARRAAARSLWYGLGRITTQDYRSPARTAHRAGPRPVRRSGPGPRHVNLGDISLPGAAGHPPVAGLGGHRLGPHGRRAGADSQHTGRSDLGGAGDDAGRRRDGTHAPWLTVQPVGASHRTAGHRR